MGMKLRGLDAALSTFREVDRRFSRAAAREIELGAKAVADLARKYAPIDRGDLVRSIRALRKSEKSSYAWRVKVGGTIGGRDVSAYAARAHELMMTTRGQVVQKVPGRLRPGKKSRNKAGSSGHLVGGGYLRRAFDDLAKDIQKRITAALKNEAMDISTRVSRKGRK